MELDDFDQLQTARRLWEQGQPAAALSQFEVALAVRPDNLRAIVEAARAFGQRYHIAQAESLLQRAEQLAGDNPNVVSQLAASYRVIGRPLTAIRLLEQQAARPEASVQVWAELSVLYEQTNRLELGIELARRCVQEASQQPELQLILARLLRQDQQFEEARRVLQQMRYARDQISLLNVRLAMEWAHLHDATQEFDEAMTSAEQSKQLMRQLPYVPRLRERSIAIDAMFRAMIERCTEAWVAKWRSAAAAAVADAPPRCAACVQLIGFPRSGTTLIEQRLAAHPQIVTSSETPVFAREIFPQVQRASGSQPQGFELLAELDEATQAAWRAEYFDKIEALLGRSVAGCTHIDKNPNHTTLAIALLRVFPESKFIFAIRDPRDVVVSAYLNYFPLNEYSVAFLDLPSLCRRYACDLDFWRKLKPLIADATCEVRYEGMVADARGTVRETWQQLGLPAYEPAIPASGDALSQASGFINSPSQAAVRRPEHNRRIARWRHYEKYLEPHLAELETYCHEFGYN